MIEILEPAPGTFDRFTEAIAEIDRIQGTLILSCGRRAGKSAAILEGARRWLARMDALAAGRPLGGIAIAGLEARARLEGENEATIRRVEYLGTWHRMEAK